MTTSVKQQSTDEWAGEAAVTARTDAGAVLLRVTSGGATGLGYLTAVRRLSDGAVVAAVRVTLNLGPCGTNGFAVSAPRVLAFGGTDKLVGMVHTAGEISWSPWLSALPVQTGFFENDLGWGMAFVDGTLRVMFPPESGKLVTIDTAGVGAISAVGRRNLIAFNPVPAGGSDHVVRIYDPVRGVRTLVQQPETTIVSIALSDTALVWMGGQGPSRPDGKYEHAEIYWAPWPGGLDSVPANPGITLPLVSGSPRLQTWGDYAAIVGSLDGLTVMYVVRFSDRRLWTIRQRPGAQYQHVLAISSSEILTGEINYPAPAQVAYEIQHLTRYELSRLDDIEKAW